MASKETGYDFWHNVLQSPKYVAAPMVDMSELAFRMLCRRHGADLCYSQMLHSQQFCQDSLYRSDAFSTMPEDRPLIVQFCANDPTVFVNASAMVASDCNAVDLNLGCPQSIAKKGHYGAFLQDEWDLIRNIVGKASDELPVPVTCKMRILSGPSLHSVEYARMLEDSGCSVLTVHGRTRYQRGHSTGLASWDVIKDIKESVKIPVIANGNILSFADVQACLEYTGADAVMSAEGLLHNPSLFSGKNPPVWEIAEEYLTIAEEYDTPLRNVRNHMFRILYLCLHQDVILRQQLERASSYSDFRLVCKYVRTLPFKTYEHEETVSRLDKDLDLFMDSLKITDESAVDDVFLSLSDTCLYFPENNNNEELICNSLFHTQFSNCDIVSEQKILCIDQISVLTNSLGGDVLDSENNQFIGKTIAASNNEELILNCEQQFCDKTSDILNAIDKSCNFLPAWVCHSRPRIVVDNEGRGCYRRYFNVPKSDELLCNDEDNCFLSKRQLRKLRHHTRVLAAMKDKRKIKKLRRKQKLLELKENKQGDSKTKSSEKITKKQAKEIIRQRMLSARGSAPKICIDFGFTSHMSKKELHKLSAQLRRLYGSNRHSIKPLHIYFCNFSTEDPLYEICKSKNDGFCSYVVDMSENGPEELFDVNNLVYLSPDSENVLHSLDCSKIYVIGGIVDGTVRKGLTLDYATEMKVNTARLPILEQLKRHGLSSGTTVLTVNQVFDVLLKFYETGDWVEALSAGVPQRKGFRAPTEPDDRTTLVTENDSNSGSNEEILNLKDA